jgi:Asp-tRNA(Asn)/Glu-tRNA(Gln) amidotransferase A subunit family amidase
LELTLAELDDANPTLNAVVTLRRDAARSEALQADRALARGEPRPLEGLPFTVKDLIATAGLRTTAGSLVLRDHVPSWTAPAIARLQRAGAILIGKTNCPEFGIGNLHTSNRVFGDTLNPWNASRTPGGSSGGDAVAVATGLAAFGVGTDYGGSVRGPAHCTGIASIRPTPGRIPTTGVLPHSGIGELQPPNSASFQSWTQTLGPLARSARDLAILVDVMQGRDGLDVHAVTGTSVSPEDEKLDTLACAWFREDGTVPVRSDLQSAIADAAAALREYGLSVEERPPPGFDRAGPVYERLRSAEGMPDHVALLARRDDELSAPMRAALAAVQPVSFEEYRRRAGEADEVRARILAFMQEWPILLLPVGSVPAFPVTRNEASERGVIEPRSAFETCCRAVSLLRAPAAVVPCGTSTEGLPIGIQIVGRPFHDAEVLAVAAALERVFGAWQPPARVSAPHMGL